MLTIEVLVALLILFLAIMLSASSIKFFNQIIFQQQRYEDIYILTSSIKEKISSKICKESKYLEDEFNNIAFIATCSLIKEKRGFREYYDDTKKEFISDFSGNYIYQIYRVNLTINEKTNSYLITTYKSLN